MTKRWSCLPVFFAAAMVCAQEPAYLSAFDLTDQEDAVRLTWTMLAGSTCEGTDVLRGRDSLQLSVVGGLGGLCGSLDGPVSYDFTDRSIPGFGIWYYQLRLGLTGFSPIRRIEHLLSSAAEVRVQPDPVIDELTVILRANDRAKVSLRIVALDGRAVKERSALTGNVHRLDVSDLPTGTYIVTARWEGSAATARFQIP